MSAKEELFQRLFALAYFGEANGEQVRRVYLEVTPERLRREVKESARAEAVKEILLRKVKP